MKECNVCTRKGCSTVESYRRKRNNLTPEDMGKCCPVAQMPKPFKVKVLYHVLITSPQATMEILHKAHIEIRETDRYPGFKLVIGGDE